MSPATTAPNQGDHHYDLRAVGLSRLGSDESSSGRCQVFPVMSREHFRLDARSPEARMLLHFVAFLPSESSRLRQRDNAGRQP